MQLSPRHLTKGISIRDILLIIETALIKLYIFNVSRKKEEKKKTLWSNQQNTCFSAFLNSPTSCL